MCILEAHPSSPNHTGRREPSQGFLKTCFNFQCLGIALSLSYPTSL